VTLSVAQIDRETEQLIDAWLTLPEVARRLELPIGRTKQLLKDHKLLGVRREGSGGPQVPDVFLDGKEVMKGLPGTLPVLQDAGYNDGESLRWLDRKSVD
jgi:hypothetical protein